jgi:hypothetical protein
VKKHLVPLLEVASPFFDQSLEVRFLALHLPLVDIFEVVRRLHHTDEDETFVRVEDCVLVAEALDHKHM